MSTLLRLLSLYHVIYGTSLLYSPRYRLFGVGASWSPTTSSHGRLYRLAPHWHHTLFLVPRVSRTNSTGLSPRMQGFFFSSRFPRTMRREGQPCQVANHSRPGGPVPSLRGCHFFKWRAKIFPGRGGLEKKKKK